MPACPSSCGCTAGPPWTCCAWPARCVPIADLPRSPTPSAKDDTMTATALPSHALLTEAPPRPTTGNAAVASTLALRPDVWRPLVGYREETRWTRLVEPALLADVLDPALHDDLAAAEVWLLSWLPGQGTALHDHGSSAGAFAVAQGVLSERVVAAGRGGRRPREVTGELGAGRVRYF